MRNVKKFLALVLAMLMVVSAAATVSAFEDVAEDNLFAEAIADLTVLEIVNGYDGETFGPEDAVTRQQFALMMARAITGIVGDDAVWAQGGLVGFEDVTEYQYAIATVVKAGIVDGFLDNTFRPDEGVTFIQALKMAVAALGYDDGNLDWWQGYYNVALDLGLTENLNQITDADKALNRGEVAQLVWNMLYAPSANGSSLAYDIFGIGVEEPVEEPATVTTLVVTATTKQYATENIDVAEGGFVGVQEIVNGVPAGEVYYVAIDALGFEDDAAAEAAYLSAYNFYNWDAEAVTFDAVEETGLSEVITNADVTVNYKEDKKIKIAGVPYYPVEETTGSAIKNEIVIFNADEHLYRHTDKILGTAKDGFVYKWMDKDADGVYAWEQVLEAVYNKGELVYYKDLVNGGYLTEEKAVAKYGEVESDYEVSLEILDVEDLFEVPAYQMSLYDDNTDGEWDRAYVTTIYVSAHDTTVKNNAYEYGPMKNDADAKTDGKKYNFPVTWVDVEGNAVELAQGDVYKYTYNEQLNQVTVLDTYEIQYGTIERIYTVNDKSSANYEVAIRINGENYVLGNQYREAKGIDGFVLANKTAGVNALANLKGLKNDGTGFNTDKVASINYTYDVNFAPETFKAKNYVGFVAVDGIIILMEAISDEANFKYALFENFEDYDTDAIYLDLWVNGVVEEDVAVTRIQKANGKYADVADLGMKDLMNAYQYYLGAEKGDVYKYALNETGVTLSRAMDEDTADEELFETTKNADGTNKYSIVDNEYNLAYVDIYSDALTFADGIGERDGLNNYVALRTNSNTLFYFVNTVDETITTFKGIPEDGWYITNKATVYTNKLGFNVGTGKNANWDLPDGYVNSINGVASTVVVYFDDIDEIGGFNVNGLKSKLVYMTKKAMSDYLYFGQDGNYFDPYENYNGYDLGLERQYWDEEFYLYTTAAGIDMKTGAKVSKFYVHEDAVLEGGKFYWMTNSNVIIDDALTDAEVRAAGVKTEAGFKGDIVTDYVRDYTVNSKFSSLAFDNVYALSSAEDNSKIKTSKTDINALTSAAKVNVYYMVNDGVDKDVLVAIVDTYTAPASTTLTTNGTWGFGDAPSGSGTVVANVDVNNLTGTVTYADASKNAITGWCATKTTPAKLVMSVDKLAYDADAAGYIYKNVITTSKLDVTGTITKGVLTISSVKNAGTSVALDLEPGNYRIYVRIQDASISANDILATWEITVPAAN